MLVQKGCILHEIEKLKNLDHHRRKLTEIQERNTRRSVKVKTGRWDQQSDPNKEK